VSISDTEMQDVGKKTKMNNYLALKWVHLWHFDPQCHTFASVSLTSTGVHKPRPPDRAGDQILYGFA